MCRNYRAVLAQALLSKKPNTKYVRQSSFISYMEGLMYSLPVPQPSVVQYIEVARLVILIKAILFHGLSVPVYIGVFEICHPWRPSRLE